ncbi:MAG: exopolysaccharide biosynthesis polyprenyl glycosylphosphotransferase [Patescibacteria group bacterium]
MRDLLIQFKMFFLFLADLGAALFALCLMILVRYGTDNFTDRLSVHLIPFSFVIILFILTFYIFNLYSFRFNKNTTEFTNSFIKSLLISFVVSVLVFYIFGNVFQLTPKTNLLLFTIIFGIIDFYLRIMIKRLFTKNKINRKVVVISGENELVDELLQNQNINYEIIHRTNIFNLDEIIKMNPDVVAIDINQLTELEKVYKVIKKDISIYSINNFYEEVFQKVPTQKIEKSEIIEYISKNKTIFNFIKRSVDIVLSIILLIVFSPLFIIITILIKLTSKGPVLIKQKRTTKNGEAFILYKFRSMIAIGQDGQSEKNGPVWTPNNKEDPRITPVGRIIRQTHLDEIPQIVNILRGEISFVGPRPERPEFIELLKKDILYYDLRHSIQAGLTGWAQVNYKYGSSVDDTKEKLKYDFYYIKNRNIFFDFLIILKTVAKFFTY